MQAMVLNHVTNLTEDHTPLTMTDLPEPTPGAGEILIKVAACGVCHTELDEIEGRLPPPQLPIVLGHQVVGRVEAMGRDVESLRGGYGPTKQSNGELEIASRDALAMTPSRVNIGDRVGVAWINSACGTCEFCRSGRENLCPDFKATGLDANGGYAQYTTVRADFAYRLPDELSDSEAAPLLCAGAIGYRSLALTNVQDGQVLGMTGFGASAHLVLQMARYRYPNSPIMIFARSEQERAFALELGANWAGDTPDRSPQPCAAIIDTTPVWTPVVEALKNLAAGGRLVINAIRKENVDQNALLKLDYAEHLWREKEIKSVANVTRRDVLELLKLAAEIPLRPEVETFELAQANRALVDLKHRHIRGAKVLIVA